MHGFLKKDVQKVLVSDSSEHLELRMHWLTWFQINIQKSVTCWRF